MSIDAPAKVIPQARQITTKPRRSDQIFRIVVTIGGMASLVILGLIALFLSIKGMHILIDEKFNFINKINTTGIEFDSRCLHHKLLILPSQFFVFPKGKLGDQLIVLKEFLF